jgi:NO-binding membrane sensor protein with MHYT domain
MDWLGPRVEKIADTTANHETRIVVLEGLVSGMRADMRQVLELMEKRERETFRTRDWAIIGAFAVGFAILAWMLYVRGPNG